MTLVDHDGVIEKLAVKALATPTHSGVRLDEGEGLETTRPNAVAPDSEHALVMPDARPPAVSGGGQGEQFGLHPPDAIAPDQETLTKSNSTRFVVGTGCHCRAKRHGQGTH